jgi:hypothetical protein
MKGQRGYKVVGQTEDGKIIVQGVFRMINQEGISVTELLYLCEIQNMMPDWIDFCRDAVKCQWSPVTILCRLGPALEEVYGSEMKNIIIERLRRLMSSAL